MCGIAGIINKTPREFDYATFCTLGIANDSRGGDSCGVFIDGKYDYGVNENKLFSNYFQDNSFIDNIKTSSIALLHCRKASVGAISKDTAQPIVLTKNNNIEFVVIHNGTIHNYQDLAKKYIPDINITGMTDSQVMTRIFYYSGYDVLNEYNGGSAFAIVDYRENSPRVFLFKGASKKYNYSKDIEIERPLYFCIDKNNQELIFSSIGIYLLALRKNCITYSVRSNELLEFTGSSLVTIKEYDRKNCIQNKEIKFGLLYKNDPYDYGYYGRWNDYSDDTFTYHNYIVCSTLDNVYLYKGKRINGKLCITRFGFIESDQKKGCDVWFFDGVALKNSHCYKFLNKIKEKTKLSDLEFNQKFETLIRYLSIDKVFRKGNVWYQAISPNNSVLFTGTLQQLTSYTITEFNSGVKQLTKYAKSVEPISSKISDKLELNFKTIKEECMSLMK